jgi:hypothetical protein
MTWEELVASVSARHPLRRRQSRHLRVLAGSVEPTPVRESKMFGMPCFKRENGKVVAGLWKDGGVNVKLVDEAQREAALAIPGAVPFDPGMGRPLQRRQSRHLRVTTGSVKPTPMREWVLVPATQSDQWERLVDQAIG